MRLTSPAFSDNGVMPPKYTCDGEELNPSLEIADVPKSAASLALIVDDPDAPSGDFVHWIMWNLPPELREIPEGIVPERAVQGQNSAGTTGWISPCPPSGTHHYHFTLYALDRPLTLPGTARLLELKTMMQGHVLDQVRLTGLYART